MFEYLNAIAAVLLLLNAVILLRKERLDMQRITNGIKSVNEVLDFLGSLPRWIELYNNLTVNVHSLRERRQTLLQRKNDLKERILAEEFQTSRLRRREVDHWLKSSETRCTEAQTLLQRMERETNWLWKFVYRAWLGNLVERKIKEVDELHSSGDFEEVLSRVRVPLKLVTSTIVGYTANRNITTIISALSENQVTKIGVFGVEGIGKTALMKHIHNQLLTGNDYEHVIMISVNENHNECHLQGEIANQLQINLEEEDIIKRAAILNHALSQRKFVLIIDGLITPVSDIDMGIPLAGGILGTGKMIVTSRSFLVCSSIACDKIIAMEPLSNNEALELFRQKLEAGLHSSEPVDVAMEIVEQCEGVPLKIINKAADLRGLNGIRI